MPGGARKGYTLSGVELIPGVTDFVFMIKVSSAAGALLKNLDAGVRPDRNILIINAKSGNKTGLNCDKTVLFSTRG